MKNYKPIIYLLSFITVVFSGCQKRENADPKYIAELNEWHTQRVSRLKAKTGWLNLAGLYWLKQGENTFGSGQDNDIIFPQGKSPEKMGSFLLTDTLVTIKVIDEVEVKSNGEKITEMELRSDITDSPTILAHNSLSWFIVQRDEKIGIRLRDYEADLVKSFTGIDRFPVDSNWQIKAKFIPFEEDSFIEIPNVLGQITKVKAPGKVVFNIDGKEYSLIPSGGTESLFFVFADGTSGKETYGAGRFLYIPGPDENNNVILDFNKSYNPPCAFTKFATCPLPPKENYLKVDITAGEKKFGDGHH
ncbi:MAG: DUF1684 domain-containing protein [Melioribacteraceae bacterium]|nr:DUF1684 domain-containing protein [Melioribacteraceae bacterium]